MGIAKGKVIIIQQKRSMKKEGELLHYLHNLWGKLE
jgi:hypothetical protein